MADEVEKSDRTVLINAFHDSNVGQGIVSSTVSVAIVGIGKEDQVARLGRRIGKEGSIFDEELVNELNSVASDIEFAGSPEDVNPISQENGSHVAAAIKRESSSVHVESAGLTHLLGIGDQTSSLSGDGQGIPGLRVRGECQMTGVQGHPEHEESDAAFPAIHGGKDLDILL